MILEKEQISRYLRHIIMPEISGPGQKKLLESIVLVYGESIKELSPMIYYLAASGIGKIYCSLDDENNFDDLLENIHDLNNDIKICLIDSEHLVEEANFKIILGSDEFFSEKINIMKDKTFIPTVVAITTEWKGFFQSFDDEEIYNQFISVFQKFYITKKKDIKHNSCGKLITDFILGTICVVEGIKLCLKLDDILNDLLHFDILTMEVQNIRLDKVDTYIRDNKDERVGIDYNYINEKLSKSKVLIIGTGGLGSPAAFALARAGVGTIGLVDSDIVEISNLNRQILHSASRIGMPKVESAKLFLNAINPYININTYNIDFNKEVSDIINDYDIVISAVDNLQTRYLINDACYFAKKIDIEAGVLRFHGTNTTIIPDKGHCYRCLTPSIPTKGLSCAETGVLGPIPGIMGFIQAAEAIKLIGDIGVTLKNKILMYDALDRDITIINVNKNPECPLCGEHPIIDEIEEYRLSCNNNVLD